MILVVDKSMKNAHALCDIFYFMGIISVAAKPDTAVKIVTNRHTAIVLCNPEKMLWPEELIRTLRSRSLGSPVFALAQDKDSFINNHKRLSMMFDKVFSDRTFSSTFIKAIIEYQREHSLPVTGEYIFEAINATAYRKNVTFFDYEIPYTKTEKMIIRYLIRMYPAPARLTDIMKHAFKHTCTSELSNIRTHISLINKKHRDYVCLNLIYSEPRVGYRILPFKMAHQQFIDEFEKQIAISHERREAEKKKKENENELSIPIK